MEVFLKRLSFWTIIIALPIVVLLSSVELAAFNKEFYREKYDTYQVVENTGIEKDELMSITSEMLDYLKGNRKDLEVYGEVHGENRMIFDERDQAHMVDVQVLFRKGVSVRSISLMLLILSFITLCMKKEDRRKAIKAVFLSGIISISTIILLGLIIATDFSRYFDIFHYVLFDNDLWRLDPNKSILINLVPLEFFIDIAVKIALYFFGTMGVCILLSGMYLKKHTIKEAI